LGQSSHYVFFPAVSIYFDIKYMPTEKKIQDNRNVVIKRIFLPPDLNELQIRTRTVLWRWIFFENYQEPGKKPITMRY